MTSVQLDQALADQMIDRGVAFCAEKRFAGDTQQALNALRQGRCDVCDHLSYSLVRQVSDTLGQIDHTVRAVYAFEAERVKNSEQPSARQKTGLNLVVWVDRKSAALLSLGATLETVLAKSRRKLGCPRASPACYVLSLQMVDDRDVQERRGYGMLVENVFLRSVPVWARFEEPAALTGGAGADLEEIAPENLLTPFNPDLAPEEMLIEQALLIESLQPEMRRRLEHRLVDEKVAIIRRLLSDQLAYINVAREWFTVADLVEIRKHKIGGGKVGGKSAGLLLAARILDKLGENEALRQSREGEALRRDIIIPRSFFLGADLIYVFMTVNGLMHWNEQKYKPETAMRNEYPRILEEFQQGEFPPEILEKFQTLLEEIGSQPLIVRSSSQLEDNFGTSFAGKYDSHFCSNQGTPTENLHALTRAIARTYASTLKPEALLYRRSKGLQDYDERMAILIQPVQGERYGNYYLPHAAGVAFSRNLYRWSPQIRREDGFARLVWGLGTRAVERGADDFPRLVALSHPLLMPDDSCEAVRRYSQQKVDLIDLQANEFKTLPVHSALTATYPPLRYLAELEQDGYFTPVRSRVPEAEIPRLALTFQELLRRTPLAERLRSALKLIEQHYRQAVDIEFTVQVTNPQSLQPGVCITLLQCRPQATLAAAEVPALPGDLSKEQIAFRTSFMVPRGYIPDIRYVLFVDPQAYYALGSAAERAEVARLVGRLNGSLAGQSFICVGPGRWGTANPELGVTVSYADIFNASALVEMAGRGIGPEPEPSLGTHFFQDLMEAQIYPLVVCLDDPGTTFSREFFYAAPDCSGEWLGDQGCGPVEACLRLLRVEDFRPDCRLELIMDDERGLATAYFVAG
jgi:hypothetical protein